MKLLPILATVGLVIGSCASNATSPENVVNDKIHSKILDQDRELIIHLPPKYDKSKKYPVMFVLDGSSQDGPISHKFDSLSALGLAPETIVVGIPNMSRDNRTFQLVPPFMLTDHEKPDSGNGTADKFLAFMESELIPYMAEKYNATGLRSFAGNSRGGLVVLYSLIYKPGLFNGRFCFSTPMWRQDNLLVTRVSEFLSSHPEQKSFLFISAGANETDNIRGGVEAMKRYLAQSSPKGLAWHVEFTPNVDHQLNSKVSAKSGILKWGEYVKGL